MESKVGAALLPRILAKTVCPVVMVLATPLAEAACGKNDLSLVQLLRPFCTMDHINVPVRTTSDNPYRLQEFHLRCFYASEIQQMPVEAAEAQLLDVVSRASDAALDELKGDPRQIGAVQQMVQAESTSSWFQQYSSAFMQTLVFSEHEAIDHPVACLLVVSSKDENHLGKFEELYNIENWPPLMKDGTVDPRILKHYVVLHDKQDGPPDSANEIVEELRGALGGNECRLLCINSGPDDVQEESNRKLGCYLGNSDFDEIQGFMLDLCLKQIIPYLEQKVRVLNQQVSATRKGLKNQIKNLWWRKKDAEVAEVPAGYTFSSMESQIRALADYSFMLRDYDLALSNYRLISSDYKADKAMKRYAGTMEMIGLCMAMLDQSRRETESALETAYVTYLGCGPPTARFATRVAFLWAEVHKFRGQFHEAAYVLSRAATDVDEEASLRAAVLLEQSAYCYLRCAPPMLRKYGFHLVLAGARYYVNGQKKHANRVYTGALSIYDNQGWIHINDHVSIHLARISSILGQTDVAIQHFLNLFACNQQPPSSQILLLKEFLAAVESLGSQSKDEVIRVGLPAISPERVYVRFEDHRTYASASAASLPEEMWRRLEEGLVPSSTASLPTWLDAPKAGQKNAQDFNICFEGEEVAVSIEMQNPLQIPIEVSCMELICIFESQLSPGAEKGDGSESELPPLVLSSESFILKGAERKEISLKAKPTREGLLTIVGIKWVFFGVVSSTYDFPVQANAKTRANKMGIPRHRRLKFRVVSRMPRLEVSLHELPSKLNVGELRRVVLEIHNASSSPIKNMKLRTSHPGFLMVGEQGDLDLEFPNCLELPDDTPPGNAHLDTPGSVFCFPQELVLDVASTLLWPVWFHARQAGELSLNTVLYYESAEEAPSRKYRTLRMTHSLQVMPAVEVSVRISPSPGKLDAYLVRMDVANLHSSESFWLRQASCVEDSWCFTAVQPQVLEQSNDEDKAAYLSVSVAPSQLLSPSQSSSFFFHLQEKPAAEEGKRNNVGLWPVSSKERFIDIYSRPLMYFQQQEQQCQTRKDQVADASENKFVDLILIFEQHDGMVSDRPPALGSNYHFSSYHLCHCPVEGFLSVGRALRGPRCLGHDFAKQPVCEIPFGLALKNCSKVEIMVRVETIDAGSAPGVDEPAALPGWRSVSPPPSLGGLASEASGTPIRSPAAEIAAAVVKVTPCEAYVWCGPKSVTVVEVAAGCTVEVPLRVAVFSPGTYDISSYRVTWSSARQGRDAASAGSTRTAASTVKSSKFIPAPATRSASFSALKTAASAQSLLVDDDVATTNALLGHPFLLTVLQDTSDTNER